jgi:hypothetical protein
MIPSKDLHARMASFPYKHVLALLSNGPDSPRAYIKCTLEGADSHRPLARQAQIDAV